MSEENINPEVQEEQAAIQPENTQEAPQEASFADKSLSELSDVFKNLMDSADRMLRSKEAESIKSAFYKLLGKLRSEAGEVEDSFADVEENFKSLYADYKRERAEYNKEQDALKEENLEKKKAIIEELKALIDGSDDVSASFPAFRDIQDRWRATGPVPATAFRDINSTYQFNVERFYDKVKINRELRDLDFQKNLEAKEKFCEAAEKLSENENIVNAFNELQKLHEQWKEFGPVAKDFRESIWSRFQAATAVINKRYQAHFEELKGKQKENLAAKEALCVKVEEIAAREIKSSDEWNSSAKEIEAIQADWRKIGFATKKENQKIYDRFRAACDEFFAERDKNAAPENNYFANLKAKKKIVEDIKAYVPVEDAEANAEAAKKFAADFQAIGFVPFKEKDNIMAAYREAMQEKFPEFGAERSGRGRGESKPRERSVKDTLIQQYKTLQQEVETFENNIGFFSASKNSESLIKQMESKIAKAKEELRKLEEKIRKEEEGE